MEETVVSGCYLIKCFANNKVYVGKSRNIKNRWNTHLCLLRVGKHPNQDMQNDFNEYGEKSFEFKVLPYIDCHISRCEYSYMIMFESYDSRYGYNNLDVGLNAFISDILRNIDFSAMGRERIATRNMHKDSYRKFVEICEEKDVDCHIIANELCGMSNSTVHRWKSGDLMPTKSNMEMIAKALETPITEFYK